MRYLVQWKRTYPTSASLLCTLSELIYLLNNINDPISNLLLLKIQSVSQQLKSDEFVKIEMTDYVLSSEWQANTSLNLKPVDLPNGSVAYYEFQKINEWKTSLCHFEN
ncbi:MAG: hypothetical protein M3Q58_16850 [Bacteroidota bacterium]|nr:hypothetical protein [Bacteroidota bacterium]